MLFLSHTCEAEHAHDDCLKQKIGFSIILNQE